MKWQSNAFDSSKWRRGQCKPLIREEQNDVTITNGLLELMPVNITPHWGRTLRSPRHHCLRSAPGEEGMGRKGKGCRCEKRKETKKNQTRNPHPDSHQRPPRSCYVWLSTCATGTRVREGELPWRTTCKKRVDGTNSFHSCTTDGESRYVHIAPSPWHQV